MTELELTADRLLPPSAVMEMVSLSRTTIWRLAKRGEFPRPVRLSAGRVGWSASAVQRWIAAKKAGGGQ
jgi:prophage regulatory protein